MIGNVVPHGRTAKDAARLEAHLLSADTNERLALRIDHGFSSSLREALRDMQSMRDSTPAESAFLHISLSPRRAMTDEELHRAADIVVGHFGAQDHLCARVIHQKPRIGGEGGSHIHLVVGRVGPNGQVLRSGLEKIRLETACRIVEFELGEPATLGRHHARVLAFLQERRPAVAAWLVEAYGSDPVLPESAVSQNRRRAQDRAGVDFRGPREIVRRAKDRADSGQALRAALEEGGLRIEPGRILGVWVVMEEGELIGSLDRLARVAADEKLTRLPIQI